MKIVVGNIMAIYRKELQGYFVSPLAYAIASVFWFLTGGAFVATLLGSQGIIEQAAFLEMEGQQVDVPYTFLQLFLPAIGDLSLFILPILSMGLYSEERKRRTLELLATSPITNWAVATGKLLGVITFFVTMLVPLMIFEAIALSASNPPISPTIPILAHLGLILLAASILSLGMFISSLTDSTILAAFLTFALIVILWVIDFFAANVSGALGDGLEHLSLLKHYTDMIKGVFDSSGLIVFISYILLGIFLTAQSIEALRFQRS